MATARFTTQGLAPQDRSAQWAAVIADAYFPLDLTFREPARFGGVLEVGALGEVSLSRLRTGPVRYERRRHHLGAAVREEYLVTIPRCAPVSFRQLGREVRCGPGSILLERGDEPYRFSYEGSNDLCVLKVDKASLTARLRDPDRYCARAIDASGGVGALFVSMARQVQACALAGPSAPPLLGRQLVELLALALQGGGQGAPEGGDAALAAGGEGGSAIRAAHRQRAEAVIAEELCNPDLGPELIAAALGISKRYLHDLFADSGTSIASRIREQRLLVARDLLAMPGGGRLCDIAYRFGFADQAQFSRLFRQRFGETPSGYRGRLAG